MNLLQRHRWFAAAAGITLAFAAVSLVAHKSLALTAFADLTGLMLMLAGAGISLDNAFARPPHERSFWALLTLSFSLWACNQAAWSYHEIILKSVVPDPYFFDIILFFHPVPLIAAAGWRPDILKKRSRLHLSVLNFLMLLGWWIFLYAFIVFPHQYVVQDLHFYNLYYDRLYGVENAVLLIALGIPLFTSSGGWRRLYLNFFAAVLIYGVNSEFLDRATVDNTYYSGSPYDIALIATVAWMAAAALSSRDWNLTSIEFKLHPQWKRLVPNLVMLALLSLPILGLWTLLLDTSAAPSRQFRIFAVLSAMLLLGGFFFLRQYFQDQALISLLEDSRRGYESQKRLQTQLVQKEKLASLGALVAGAAHEINHPLSAIMNQSEQLWSQQLTDE